jgi:hypothetical protein
LPSPAPVDPFSFIARTLYRPRSVDSLWRFININDLRHLPPVPSLFCSTGNSQCGGGSSVHVVGASRRGRRSQNSVEFAGAVLVATAVQLATVLPHVVPANQSPVLLISRVLNNAYFLRFFCGLRRNSEFRIGGNIQVAVPAIRSTPEALPCRIRFRKADGAKLRPTHGAGPRKRPKHGKPRQDQPRNTQRQARS